MYGRTKPQPRWSIVAQIDGNRQFVAVNIAVLTISDSRTRSTDTSGDLLADCIAGAGHTVADRDIVPDDVEQIVSRLRSWAADAEIDVVISTGGTGVTGRDVTPEALAQIAEKDIPGFGELFRMISYEKVGTSALQSRAAAAVANGTYFFALPGSPGACRDAWEGILQHQLDSRHKPCNFVELMPRLNEHRG